MDALRRLAQSSSAVLGTVDRDRGVHLVPVVFTVVGDDRIVIAVDSKPKRSRRLRRRLWWVRVDGRASVRQHIEGAVEDTHRTRYPQLEGHDLGPWIDIAVESVSGWSAF